MDSDQFESLSFFGHCAHSTLKDLCNLMLFYFTFMTHCNFLSVVNYRNSAIGKSVTIFAVVCIKNAIFTLRERRGNKICVQKYSRSMSKKCFECWNWNVNRMFMFGFTIGALPTFLRKKQFQKLTNSSIVQHCSVAFQRMVTLHGLIHKWNCTEEPHRIVKETIPQYSTVYTAWFDPPMKKIEPHCIVNQTVPQHSTVQ